MGKVSFIVSVFCLISLTGCKLNLDTTDLNKDVTPNIEKKFTEHEEIVYKKWRTLDMYATLLHKSMASYRNDLPPAGKTRVVFRMAGLEQLFDITKMVVTVHTGKTSDYTISGLGTENILVNGKKNDLIEYTELEKKGGENDNLLSKFSITLPFEVNNQSGYLQIEFEDTRETGKSFGFQWDFGA